MSCLAGALLTLTLIAIATPTHQCIAYAEEQAVEAGNGSRGAGERRSVGDGRAAITNC